MRKIVLSLLRQLLFWVLFFNFTRTVFLVYYANLVRLEGASLSELLMIYPNSLRLDIGTACYILVIPFLILLIQTVWSPRWLDIVNKVYTSILVTFYSLLAAGEMGIYAEWKSKLTYKVLKYFSHPSEIYNSAETGTFFLLLVIFIALSAIGAFAYIRLFYVNIEKAPRKIWFTPLFLVIMPPFLFLGMRGGVQEIPNTLSTSYYSHHNILNQAAVNNAYNLYISVFENLKNFNRDPYVFMSTEKAKEIVKRIYETPKDTTVEILTTKRPNIIIIILESWSADLIEDLGGKPGITPRFQGLEKEGILFDSVYAAGSRSEQGMACIFAGFPAHPVSSITVQPDKLHDLPSLPKIMKQQGYGTAFYFGGQLIYGNIKSYIYYNEFDQIMEVYDFPRDMPRGKLGIHDEYTLGYLANDFGKLRKPSFAALFTVSTHAPWDQPYPRPLRWGDNEHEYINAALYTDHCLGEFFDKVKSMPWYDNTLFILVADHSHNSYYNWNPQMMEYHKIPLLFYGNVIKKEFRGTRCHKLGNQHDIPATLLAQLGLDHRAFRWSKNLMNPYTPPFAYFASEDGVGWVRPHWTFSYEAGPNYYYWWVPKEIPDSVITEGKAYLQEVFRDYLER